MEALLENILEELQTLKAFYFKNNRLWAVEDIAFYLNLREDNVKQNYVNRPDFPAPIRLNQERGRRWMPEDVRKWASNLKAYQTESK